MISEDILNDCKYKTPKRIRVTGELFKWIQMDARISSVSGGNDIFTKLGGIPLVIDDDIDNTLGYKIDY